MVFWICPLSEELEGLLDELELEPLEEELLEELEEEVDELLEELEEDPVSEEPAEEAPCSEEELLPVGHGMIRMQAANNNGSAPTAIKLSKRFFSIVFPRCIILATSSRERKKTLSFFYQYSVSPL